MTFVATIYCSIRTIVKLFRIGDGNDHYQRSSGLVMVATKVTLVKIFCDGGFNDGCGWSISFSVGSRVPDNSYHSYALVRIVPTKVDLWCYYGSCSLAPHFPMTNAIDQSQPLLET